jgi:hypothetical protein
MSATIERLAPKRVSGKRYTKRKVGWMGEIWNAKPIRVT